MKTIVSVISRKGDFSVSPYGIVNALLIVCIVLTVCSCSTVGESHVGGTSTMASPTDGQIIVFGKFDLLTNGKPDTVGLFESAPAIILPEQSNKVLIAPLDSQGWFSLNIEPDTYSLLGLHYRDSNGAEKWWGLNTSFTIAPQDKAVYIGNIMLEIGKGEPILKLVDMEQSAAAEFRKRYSNSTVQPATHLLQRKQLGTYHIGSPICSSGGILWGAECTREIQGVEPIYPALKRRLNNKVDFTQIDNTQPTFSWKPVADKSLTYDLVIWEAASYQTPLGAPQYVPGKVAVYEENLSQPGFALRNSLKPKTKYMWSVRVRSNDVVSTWSTAGHFAFLLVAWSMGRGELYSFETP